MIGSKNGKNVEMHFQLLFFGYILDFLSIALFVYPTFDSL